MKQVLIPTKLNPVGREILEEKGFEVVQDAETDLEELVQQYPEAEALVVRSNKVTAEVIDALPKLSVIVRAGAGYNTIDTKHARKNDVDVMNTPGANANAVAEEVIALVLAYYRHVVRGDQTTRQGEWEKKKLMGRELAGKTVGIVGLGNIGQFVNKRLEGFEAKVLGFDPMISDNRAEQIGVELVDLEKLFSESDIITLHLPENDDTKGMINRKLLDLMKPRSVLVNCARAGIINEDDLRAVKTEKEIGFLNDVYPADEPGEKSVADIADIMLPHLGASTEEANANAARRAAEQLVSYVEHGVTKWVVNKSVPDGLDEAYQELAFQLAFVARQLVGDKKPISRIECAFYGDLGQFSEWLLPPALAGASPEFEAQEEPAEAQDFLKERGIEAHIRETDESKNYGESMTVELFAGDHSMERVSLRGTITENNLVISRINDFEQLYFIPKGYSLLAIYKDRPGVLATITAACGEANVNIEDVRCPHNRTGEKSIAVLKTNKTVPKEVLNDLKKRIDAEKVCAVALP